MTLIEKLKTLSIYNQKRIISNCKDTCGNIMISSLRQNIIDHFNTIESDNKHLVLAFQELEKLEYLRILYLLNDFYDLDNIHDVSSYITNNNVNMPTYRVGNYSNEEIYNNHISFTLKEYDLNQSAEEIIEAIKNDYKDYNYTMFAYYREDSKFFFALYKINND